MTRRKKLNSLRDEIEKAKSVDSQKFSNFEEENSSIQHLIEIDVERTYGDIKLFQDKYNHPNNESPGFGYKKYQYLAHIFQSSHKYHIN